MVDMRLSVFAVIVTLAFAESRALDWKATSRPVPMPSGGVTLVLEDQELPEHWAVVITLDDEAPASASGAVGETEPSKSFVGDEIKSMSDIKPDQMEIKAGKVIFRGLSKAPVALLQLRVRKKTVTTVWHRDKLLDTSSTGALIVDGAVVTRMPGPVAGIVALMNAVRGIDAVR